MVRGAWGTVTRIPVVAVSELERTVARFLRISREESTSPSGKFPFLPHVAQWPSVPLADSEDATPSSEWCTEHVHVALS